MKHKLTCFYLLIAIRILYGILAKVCRMLTNLLGSSWSNLFTLQAALGNFLDLKCKYVRLQDTYEIRII